MNATVKLFLKSFSEVPEGKFPRTYYTPLFTRGIIFGNYSYPAGLFAHVLFLVIFAWIGATALAYFNIFSVILWATAIFLHRRGYLWKAYYLITIEIIAHAAICITEIGWPVGFQYYVLVQPAVVFLLPGKTLRKIVISVIYTCAFAAMNYHANVTTPHMELSVLYIAIFNYGNIFSVCALLSYLSYQYYQAAITTEKKLEKEHQKTAAALNARNQVLERLNRELAEAAEYVRTILPPPITEGSIRADWRFIPSKSLGGDAFGYHMLDEDHFAIYLTDVSGHGVGAALLSVSVVNVLRSQSLPNTDFKDPEQVLEALNIAFPGEENNDMFFTIWYGVYHLPTRTLTYASAGHPPAILFTKESNVTQLKTRNFVIGGMLDVAYEQRIQSIDIDASLYVFSDGVYEIEKEDGSRWSFGEYISLLSSLNSDEHNSLDSLYGQILQISKGGVFEDDYTILRASFI